MSERDREEGESDGGQGAILAVRDWDWIASRGGESAIRVPPVPVIEGNV